MKLIYGPPSPYSRKARIAIAEKGLEGQIEQVARNPFEDIEDVRKANPIGKVPVLLLNDGTMLFDSPVVCEYIDSLSEDVRLIPESGTDRWTALRRQALCDAITDATVSIVMESRRDKKEQSQAWIQRSADQMNRGLDALEREISSFPAQPEIAGISAICTLDFIDLRTSHIVNWRQGRPKLGAWHTEVASRPSVTSTAPPL